VDRLRFLFGLIVPEGFHDGKLVAERIYKELQVLYGKPISIEFNTNITETKACFFLCFFFFFS
jgi:hypothetical protein